MTRRALACILLASAGCTVEPMDFEDKRCPCDVGFTCDRALDRCFPNSADGGAPADGGTDGGAPGDAAVEPGLLAWYPLDLRAGGAEDRSGHGHHASCAAASCPASVEGVLGGAADFHPLQFLVVPDIPGDLSTPDGLTIAVWVRPADWQKGVALAKKREAASDEPVWALGTTATGQAELSVRSLLGGTVTLRSDLGVVPADAWTHLAATWDPSGDVLRLYVGGEEVPRTGAGAPDPGLGPLLIGGDESHAELPHYPGALDEARLYDRPLSAEAVRALASP